MEMCAKNMAATHSFLGLKIVPQIVEETNVRGKAVSRSCKDIRKDDMVPPLPQYPVVDPSSSCVNTHSKPFRRLRPTTSLPPEREAGLEILDILLCKANSGSLTSHYIGSPPCRASNPLVHDAHFCQKRASPSKVTIPRNPASLHRGNNCAKSSPSSSSRGVKAIVRIEGFIPSNGESHHGIPTFA